MLDRIQITIKGSEDAVKFVEELYAAHYTDKLFLENEDGTCHVNAYSKLAAIYAATTFPKIYLVNEDKAGFFPACIRGRWVYKE